MKKEILQFLRVFCHNLVADIISPYGYRADYKSFGTLNLRLKIGNWTLNFTENGKNRNYGTMGAIMDFFFPYTPRLRIEAASSVSSQNPKKVQRSFFTFRAFLCQLAYEFKQLFIIHPIVFFRQNPAIAFILLLGILYPKALPVIAVIGAIAYDAVSSGNTDATSLTFSHTCSGSNRFLTVGSFLQGSVLPTGVTYNSVSLTDSIHNTGGSSIYTLVAPATGANNVVISRATVNRILAGAISFTGANQTTPIDGSGANNNASRTTNSVSFTTSYNNTFLVDCVMVTPTLPVVTIGGGQTERYNLTDAFNVRGSTKQQVAAGSATMSWSYDFSQNCELVVLGVREEAPTYINISESGSGSDTVSLLNSISVPEAGQGAEALSFLNSLGLSESGAGAETLAFLNSLGITDIGSGSELIDILNKIALSENGSASEALDILKSIAMTDTGTANEALNVLATLALSDSGSGSEVLSILLSIALSDNGNSSEAINILGQVAISDSVNASEAIDTLGQIALSDSAAGSEALNILFQIALNDAGIDAEVVEVLSRIAMSESVNAIEALEILGQIVLSDSGAGSEALDILAQIAQGDSGSGSEALSILGQIALSENGAASEAINILSQVAASDSGAATEAAVILANINVSDSGTGTDAISTVIFNLIKSIYGIIKILKQWVTNFTLNDKKRNYTIKLKK